MAQTLKKYGTEILDLRGVRFCMSEKGGDEWSNFVGRLRNIINLPSKWSSLCETLTEVTSLTQVTLDECPKEAVTLFAKGAPQLKSLSAYRIDKHCDPFWIHYNLDINFLKNMNNLITLILKNYKQQTLVFDASSSNTTDETKLNLRALTITRAINLSCIEHILPSSLVSLELGEFHSLSSDFCQVVLPKLVNLNRLRLELCHDHDLTHLLVEKVSKLPRLSELELINFSIGNGFGSALGNCTNLKSLLIIPMYKIIAQNLHPIVNSSILHGVSKLKNSLQLFVWVVTEQIISIEYVHRLRINQRRPKVRVMGRGDSIPFIFPGGGYDIDFISLDNAQSFLFQDLNFKIFKTHFSSTWKLSIHNIKR